MITVTSDGKKGKDVGTISTTPVKLELKADPDEISPLDDTPQSKITVTAKRGSDAAKDIEVQVEVSTEESTEHPDGHTHEGSGDHNRPKAQLESGGKRRRRESL